MLCKSQKKATALSKAKLILSPAFYTDLKEIRHMYQQAFKSLYGKYQDRETNPYCESLESLQKKFKRPNNAFFFIIVKDKHIGLIRVVTDRKNSAARISPFLILPSYHGKGYAQLGLQLIEEQFPLIQTWYVDTIAEEPKLVHLYRKVGFQQLPDRETTINEHMHIIYFVKVRS